YPKMVWVVHGRRRKRDMTQFFASLEAGSVIYREPMIVSVRWKEGALLRDWGASRVPVYFDFETPLLWRLSPSDPHGRSYLTPVQKAEFLSICLNGLPFEEDYAAVVEHVVAAHLKHQQAPRPLLGFERYMARRQRVRRRF